MGFHFVDDGNQPVHALEGDLFDLMINAQDSIDDYNGYVKATSQAVNTKKTFYWLINFKWCKGKPIVVKACRDDYKVTCIDKHEVRQIITQQACTDPEELLGVYMCPVDDGKQMTLELSQRIMKWQLGLKLKRRAVLWAGLP